jgi:hydroxymethylbilane synthase
LSNSLSASAVPSNLEAIAIGKARIGSNQLVIASRESRLAMWQAEHVKSRLEAAHQGLQVAILSMTTRGDQILDRPLNEIGGKGLFTKELEVALLNGSADIAVHSLKDVPMSLPDGFELVGMMEREDPRDAFVSNKYSGLADIPEGAVVGTSSLRRQVQIQKRFSHLKIQPLRGNLDTRLAKLDRGEYDAIILAAAGLKRLGLAQRIRAVITPDEMVPAAGQGVLGIEALIGRPDLTKVLAPLLHQKSYLEASAEREVSRQLGGSCRVPLAAFAHTIGTTLSLTACVGALVPNEPAQLVSVQRTVNLSTLTSPNSPAHAQADLVNVIDMARSAVAELKALGAEALLSRHLS